MSEREATQAEIYQTEAGAIPGVEVPVTITGPVDARVLPAVAWRVYRVEPSDSSGPLRAVARNASRKILRIISTTAGCHFGPSQEVVRTRGGGLLPMNVAFEMSHTEEVWVNNVATETPRITVVEEFWTN